MMEDDGAELVAEFESLSVGTANSTTSSASGSGFKKRTKKNALRSLLDDESTSCTQTPRPPPAAKEMQLRTPSSADVALCCTAFNLGCSTRAEKGVLDVMNLEGKISTMLGETIFNNWQVWSFFGGMATVPASVQVREAEIRKALHNRAFSIAERKRRMDSVRCDLSPFTPTRKKGSSTSSVSVSAVKFGKVKSFDITEHAPAVSRRSKNCNNVSSMQSMWERAACLCDTTGKEESPAGIRRGMLRAVHEDICYDSDPEDFTRRRSRRRHTNSRRQSAPLHNSLIQDDDDDEEDNHDDKHNNSQSDKENRLVMQQQNAGIDDDFTFYQMVQVRCILWKGPAVLFSRSGNSTSVRLIRSL